MVQRPIIGGLTNTTPEAVNKLRNVDSSAIPLLAEEGWLRHQSKLRSHRSAADGREARARQREALIVVSPTKCSDLNNFAELTTPAAPFRNGYILLTAQPPLLCEEGNVTRLNGFGIVHSPIDRRLQVLS